MSRIFPFPLLIGSLTIAWVALAGFTVGQFLVGFLVALVAAQGLAALKPPRPRLRRWDLIPRLVAIVLYDIVRSNIAVSRLVWTESADRRRSGFMTVPLDLRDELGLAVLAIVLTATPGTAWLDYNSARGTLLIHVFDLIDENQWHELIKNRYEQLLMEIFE